jgi:hypothetical protein
LQFLGPAGRQLAPQECFDFPWLRIEKFRQDFGIVALPRQPGLQPVNILGKYIVEKQSSTIDAVLARDTSHILKVALIFAISDQANEIERKQLEAALAVVDFCCDSARWIFGRATGNKLANNILAALCRSPTGLTRTQIQNEVCYRTTPKSQLDALATRRFLEPEEIPKQGRWPTIILSSQEKTMKLRLLLGDTPE